MENFNSFIEEIQKLEIRVKEFFIDNDYVIEEFTVEEAPNYLYKKGFFLDLSHYNNNSNYSEKLKILQQRALTELSNLSIEQINIHLNRIELILSRFSKMYKKCSSVQQRFGSGDFNKVDLELEIFSAFIIEKPENYNFASVTDSFFWDLLDAITVQKDGYLQGLDTQIREIFGIQDKNFYNTHKHLLDSKTILNISETTEESLRKTLYKKFRAFHNGNAFEFPKWEFIVRATNLTEKKQSAFATLIYHILNDLFSVESNSWFQYKSIDIENKTAITIQNTDFSNTTEIRQVEEIIDYNKLHKGSWDNVKDKTIDELNKNPKVCPTYKYNRYIKYLSDSEYIEFWGKIGTVQEKYKDGFFDCIYPKTPPTSFEDYIKDENPNYEELQPPSPVTPILESNETPKTKAFKEKKVKSPISAVAMAYAIKAIEDYTNEKFIPTSFIDKHDKFQIILNKIKSEFGEKYDYEVGTLMNGFSTAQQKNITEKQHGEMLWFLKEFKYLMVAKSVSNNEKRY